MMEQRYVKPTATHVAAELLDKKPGVRVPILTREEAQNHKVMLNEKEVLHSHRLYWFGRRTQDIVFSLLALVVLSPKAAEAQPLEPSMRGVTFASPGTVGAEVCRLLAVPQGE